MEGPVVPYPTLRSQTVKVSRRLLNVYVHSDVFSIEVIFKNAIFLATLYVTLNSPPMGMKTKTGRRVSMINKVLLVHVQSTTQPPYGLGSTAK